LLTFVDKETLTRARGATGVEYVIDIDVSPVNECDPGLVVTVSVGEAGGRGGCRRMKRRVSLSRPTTA
jgi:hypothetical protein